MELSPNELQEVLEWPIEAYGCVIRGNEDTSEDMVAEAIHPEVAKRLALCWNLLSGISTRDLQLGNFRIIKS